MRGGLRARYKARHWHGRLKLKTVQISNKEVGSTSSKDFSN